MSRAERRARLTELVKKARQTLQQDNTYTTIEMEEAAG